MKRILFSTVLIIIFTLLTVSTLAYDFYGRVMPDYIYSLFDITAEHNMNRQDCFYDVNTDRVYDAFLCNGDRDFYVRINPTDSINADEYKYVKIGYSGYSQNNTEARPVKLEIALGDDTVVTGEPLFALDKAFHEVLIDLSTLEGFDSVSASDDYTYIEIAPWSEIGSESVIATSSDCLYLEYVAFFKTMEEADAYSTERYPFTFAEKPETIAVLYSPISTSNYKSEIKTESRVAYPFLRFTTTLPAGTYANDNTFIRFFANQFPNLDIKKLLY
ncbi:MAG: hypothetical protein J6V93_02320 [Clostridia bacterium]|nr:hypothetical protein [Clostridia bacterium]